MKIDQIAQALNTNIKKDNDSIYKMLSPYGLSLYFPKGIVTQSAEAKSQAYRLNATVGIATLGDGPMAIDAVRSLVSPKLEDKDVFPYAPAAGIAVLRSLWQEQIRKSSPKIKTMSMPIVTSGLTHALSVAGDLFIDENTPVILPDLFWGNYRMLWLNKKQCKFHNYQMFSDDFNNFNVVGFEKEIALQSKVSKKIVVVLNFPHNPTGYTPSKKESLAIKAILKKEAERGTHIVVICDDAYTGLVYDNHCESQSFFEDLSQVSSNLLCIKIDGCTKQYFAWGFRVAFLTFASKDITLNICKALEIKSSGAIRATLSNSSHICQSILAKAIADPHRNAQVQKNTAVLKERFFEIKKYAYLEKYRDLWSVYPCNSGYFICLSLKKDMSSEDVRRRLLKDFGIGVVSLRTKDLRIAFSCIEKKDISEVFVCLDKCIRSF